MLETMVLPALMGLIGHNLKQLHDDFIDQGVVKWSEFETKFNSTFEEYYQTVYNHYKDVPYLLNADVKVPLREIYQPSFLIDHREGESDVLTDSLDKVLVKGDHIWIDGHGGIGKTTMLKYFLLHRLTEERLTDDMRIPVYVELRRYNEDKFRKEDFVDFLYALMQSENFKLELKYFKHMVEQGRFVFLLDAFDEVHSESQGSLAYQFIDFIKQYSGNAVIISSRHLINHAINHPQFLRLETKGLEQDQAVSLIEKIDVSGTRLSEEIKGEFIAKLEEAVFFETYQSFIANPILLLLMLKTFNSNKNFPKERAKFLLESYDYLYKEHDNNKMVSYNDREFKTNLNQETLKGVLSSFCFELYFYNSEGSYELSKHQLTSVLKEVKQYASVRDFELDDFLHDLTTCLSVLYREGDNYFFVHNVFKEFFAAHYLYQEFSAEQLEEFFSMAILEEGADWRVIQTSLDYFAELDQIYQKNRLELEVILPLLDIIEKRFGLCNVANILSDRIGIRATRDGCDIANIFGINKMKSYFIDYCGEYSDIKLYNIFPINLSLFQCLISEDEVWSSIEEDLSDAALQNLRDKFLMFSELNDLKQFLKEDGGGVYFDVSSDIFLDNPRLSELLKVVYEPRLKDLQVFHNELEVRKEEQNRRFTNRLRRQ